MRIKSVVCKAAVEQKEYNYRSSIGYIKGKRYVRHFK